jgi:hypothetical protein
VGYREGDEVGKLVYGRNGQVRFRNELEKQQAFEYLRTSPNVVLVHEDNQEQGAWGPEERIHFATLVGVPECLQRCMTAGRGNIAGRINCAELIAEVWGNGAERRRTSAYRPETTAAPSGLCCQIRAARGSECFLCGQVVK